MRSGKITAFLLLFGLAGYFDGLQLFEVLLNTEIKQPVWTRGPDAGGLRLTDRQPIRSSPSYQLFCCRITAKGRRNIVTQRCDLSLWMSCFSLVSLGNFTWAMQNCHHPVGASTLCERSIFSQQHYPVGRRVLKPCGQFDGAAAGRNTDQLWLSSLSRYIYFFKTFRSLSFFSCIVHVIILYRWISVCKLVMSLTTVFEK